MGKHDNSPKGGCIGSEPINLWDYLGTLDERFLPAMDKALAISIGLSIKKD
jgi:hypothetical protein